MKSYGNQVTVYHGVVAAKSGTMKFDPGETAKKDMTVVKGDNSYVAKTGTSAVGRMEGAANSCKLGDPKCVRMYSLDNICPKQHLLMVKADVQGGESQVFAGATKLIRERRITYGP